MARHQPLESDLSLQLNLEQRERELLQLTPPPRRTDVYGWISEQGAVPRGPRKLDSGAALQ